jgi:murein DD-endopeptidase MepM/ murein hydrolase activator NlpD
MVFPKTAFGSAPSGLSPGQVLGVGQELQDGPFIVVMQGDGNLVEYVSEPNGQIYPLWDSGTYGNPGAFAVMQSDGNLVVYRQGSPLWSSGTYGHPGAVFVLWINGAVFVSSASGLLWGVGQGPAVGGFPPQPLPSGDTELTAGAGVFDGQTITSGKYQFVMQTDGNLVVYGPNGAVQWDAGTWGQPGDWLTMQSDGNLVIYDVHGYAIWATGTFGYPGAFALMQGDSNFVVYSPSGQPLWASNSERGAYANPLRLVQSLTPQRIDQGVDYSGNGPVYAIGDGVVLSLNNNGWPGIGNITYQLTDGPGKGLDVYFAECVQPTVQAGQSVNASTEIGFMSTSCGTGIEIGWSAGDHLIPDAAAHYCYDGADPTTYGLNFSNLLTSLGAPGGIVDGPLTCPQPPSVPNYSGAPPAFPSWIAGPILRAPLPAGVSSPVGPAGPNEVDVPQLHGGQAQIPTAAYMLLQQIGQAMVTDRWSAVPAAPGVVAPETPNLRGYTVGAVKVVSVDDAHAPSKIVAVVKLRAAAAGANEVTIALQPSGVWALASADA